MGGVAWTIVDCYVLGSRELGPFPGREHRGLAQALKPMAVFYLGSWLLGKAGHWLPQSVVLGAWPFVALMGPVDS